MMTTNILLILLIGLHLIQLFNKYKKNIISKYWSYFNNKEDKEGNYYRDELIKLHSMYKKQLKIVKNDLYANEVLHKEKFSKLHLIISNTSTMYSEELKVIKDNLDAHKVFTTKSLSELKLDVNELSRSKPVDWKDKIIFSDNPNWKGGEFDLKEFFNQYGCKEEVELKPNKKTKKKLKTKKKEATKKKVVAKKKTITAIKKNKNDN